MVICHLSFDAWYFKGTAERSAAKRQIAIGAEKRAKNPTKKIDFVRRAENRSPKRGAFGRAAPWGDRRRWTRFLRQCGPSRGHLGSRRLRPFLATDWSRGRLPIRHRRGATCGAL